EDREAEHEWINRPVGHGVHGAARGRRDDVELGESEVAGRVDRGEAASWNDQHHRLLDGPIPRLLSFHLVMRGQKRGVKGVHARLRRAMDARKRACDPRIHLLCKKILRRGWIAGSSPAMTLRLAPQRALTRHSWARSLDE